MAESEQRIAVAQAELVALAIITLPGIRSFDRDLLHEGGLLSIGKRFSAADSEPARQEATQDIWGIRSWLRWFILLQLFCTKLVACSNRGQIHASSDSGGTRTARESNREWHGVDSSADGTKLVACVYNGGQIYTSSDSGVTWTARESNRQWYGVASSADGLRLVACVMGGQIYTYDAWTPITTGTTEGTSGSLTGAQRDAVELQYIGDNTFTVLSHEGSLSAQ